MVYNLMQYIETDYCLVVQNDGWVLNGKNWRDEFWDYDYIGAPVPAKFDLHHNASQQPFIWANAKAKSISSHSFMQNGGFSFRSKRLLELPRKLGLVVPVMPTALADLTQPFKMSWDKWFPTHNEDLFLNIIARPHLEKEGVKFAPLEVANYFSYESVHAPNLMQLPLESILGHHLSCKAEIVGYNNVRLRISNEAGVENPISPQLLQLLSPFFKRGYQLNINQI